MLIHSKLPKADWVIHQLIGLSADGREAYAILTGIKAGDTYHDLPIEASTQSAWRTGTSNCGSGT